VTRATRRTVKPTGSMKDFAATRRGSDPLLPMLKKVALDEFKAGNDPHWDDVGMRTIHPSEMSKNDWCPRATYYRITLRRRPEESFNFVRENIFDEGHALGDKWVSRMRKTGKLFGEWRCRLCNSSVLGLEPPLTGCKYECGHFWLYKEVPLNAEASHLIAGHADSAIVMASEDENFLVELKSIGEGTVRMEAPKMYYRYKRETTEGEEVYDLKKLWRDLKRPFTSHVKQATIYLFLARLLGLPYKRMVFLYECKWNQQVKAFTIELSDEILSPLLEKAAAIKYAVKVGKPPACPFEGCKECEAYEGEQGDTKGEPPGHQLTDGRSQQRGSGQAGGAEHPRRQVGGQTRRRTTRAARRHSEPERPGPDGAVPGVQPVEEVPENTARRRVSRRAQRRSQAE
jgi:hypothetical protein